MNIKIEINRHYITLFTYLYNIVIFFKNKLDLLFNIKKIIKCEKKDKYSIIFVQDGKYIIFVQVGKKTRMYSHVQYIFGISRLFIVSI